MIFSKTGTQKTKQHSQIRDQVIHSTVGVKMKIIAGVYKRNQMNKKKKTWQQDRRTENTKLDREQILL
jgi:hypothetical protein